MRRYPARCLSGCWFEAAKRDHLRSNGKSACEMRWRTCTELACVGTFLGRTEHPPDGRFVRRSERFRKNGIAIQGLHSRTVAQRVRDSVHSTGNQMAREGRHGRLWRKPRPFQNASRALRRLARMLPAYKFRPRWKMRGQGRRIRGFESL